MPRQLIEGPNCISKTFYMNILNLLYIFGFHNILVAIKYTNFCFHCIKVTLHYKVYTTEIYLKALLYLDLHVPIMPV